MAALQWSNVSAKFVLYMLSYFLDCLWGNCCVCVFADLEVMQVFPCRCELNSSEQGAEMEREVNLISDTCWLLFSFEYVYTCIDMHTRKIIYIHKGVRNSQMGYAPQDQLRNSGHSARQTPESTDYAPPLVWSLTCNLRDPCAGTSGTLGTNARQTLEDGPNTWDSCALLHELWA